jgi:hypothetical protein
MVDNRCLDILLGSRGIEREREGERGREREREGDKDRGPKLQRRGDFQPQDCSIGFIINLSTVRAW